MASINTKATSKPSRNFLSSYDLLRRSVMTSLLWEDNYYEDGISHVERVKSYMNDVTKEQAVSVLEEAKFQNKLRHTPLFLMTLMLKKGYLTSDECEKLITRVDDMSELLALYNKDDTNSKTIPHALKKGMATAFKKFDEYQFSKYKGKKKEVKLRDVIRVARPKPSNTEEEKLWNKIVTNTLQTPDTWEVELSKSKNKKDSWTRLLTEKTNEGYSKLGSLALLRNLRNIINSGVSKNIIKEAINSMSVKKLLPFQFISCYRNTGGYDKEIENKFFESTKDMKKLKGSSIILIDISGSMTSTLSSRSNLTRLDVAGSLAAIAKEICDESLIYTFNTKAELIDDTLSGFSLIDSLEAYGGTAVIKSTNKVIKDFRKANNGTNPTRVIVITDEQTNSDNNELYLRNLPYSSEGYMVNVSSYERGIKYSDKSNWTTISGWSENIFSYISAYEEGKKTRRIK